MTERGGQRQIEIDTFPTDLHTADASSNSKINKPNVRKVIVPINAEATSHYFIHFGGMDGRNILLLLLETTIQHR